MREKMNKIRIPVEFKYWDIHKFLSLLQFIEKVKDGEEGINVCREKRRAR